MAFESHITPHNGAFGSTTILGMVSVNFAPVNRDPLVVLADDAEVAIHGKSVHVAHTGTVTMVDRTGAESLANQAGPATFTFDCEASDGAADVSYSFAACKFGEVTESVALNTPGTCTISFAAKALTVT